jgi:hypothetical protein
LAGSAFGVEFAGFGALAVGVGSAGFGAFGDGAASGVFCGSGVGASFGAAVCGPGLQASLSATELLQL